MHTHQAYFLGQAPTAWDEIHEQKEKGEYPWTHLSHDQDAEVWIDPTALPQDMSRYANFTLPLCALSLRLSQT